jgi:hypothetical protein
MSDKAFEEFRGDFKWQCKDQNCPAIYCDHDGIKIWQASREQFKTSSEYVNELMVAIRDHQEQTIKRVIEILEKNLDWCVKDSDKAFLTQYGIDEIKKEFNYDV